MKDFFEVVLLITICGLLFGIAMELAAIRALLGA